MNSVVLVIHLFLALAIIGLVLLQRSEGGGLGIGGGGGGLASPQGAANFLTRMTAVCGGAFFCTSLLLGVMAGMNTRSSQGILDALSEPVPAIGQPLQTPDGQGGGESSSPSAPVAE